MNSQAHLPDISDEYVLLFLYACHYSSEKTKTSIENYFTLRANNPAIFDDRDVYSEKIQTLLNLA